MSDDSDPTAPATDELFQELVAREREIGAMPVGLDRFRAMNTLIDEARMAVRMVDGRVNQMSQERNVVRDELTFVKRHRGRIQALRTLLAGSYRHPDLALANFDGFALNHEAAKLRVMMNDPERLGMLRGGAFLGLVKNEQRKQALDNYERQVKKALENLLADHRAYLHSMARNWEGQMEELNAKIAHESDQKTALSAFVKELQEQARADAKLLQRTDLTGLQPAEKRVLDWLCGAQEPAPDAAPVAEK